MIEKGAKITYDKSGLNPETPMHLTITGTPEDLVIALVRIVVNIADKGGYTPESFFDCIKSNYLNNKDFWDCEVSPIKKEKGEA